MTPEIQHSRNITILNGTDGMTNCVESDVIREDLGRVTNEIFGKLKDHYGPYSLFAGIDPNKPLEDTVFTKDGANIIRSLEYISAQENWAKKIIEYIGNNIENSSGDGTTSSMMFACGMLRHMYNTISEIKPISYTQLRSIYAEFVKHVQERLKGYILTAAGDRVKELAYAQAYTSSHGNAELSEAAANLFAQTPDTLWDYVGFQRRRYESSKEIELVESTGQYEVECKPMTRSVFNERLKTALRYENATLIVLNDGLGIDNPFWHKIENAITSSTPEKPVAILAHNDGDGVTWQKLMDFTQECDENGKPHYCFAVFSTGKAPEHPTANEFVILQAICGFNVIAYNDMTSRPAIIEGVTVVYDKERLTLDKLYKEPEGFEGNYRPQYFDNSKAYFRTLADGLKDTIEAVSSGGSMTPAEERTKRQFCKVYRKLICRKQVDLVIGGKTFDNLAMFDVVDDVLRACKTSLRNGAVVSNNKSLYNAVRDFEGSLILPSSPGDTAASREHYKRIVVLKWLARNVLTTLSEFADVVRGMLYPEGKLIGATPIKKHWWSKPVAPEGPGKHEFRVWWFDNAVDILKYNSAKLPGDQDRSCAYPMRKLAKHVFEEGTSLIIQPANTDIVLLERFGEIALKFVLTERLIVHNAAYVNKKGKEK